MRVQTGFPAVSKGSFTGYFKVSKKDHTLPVWVPVRNPAPRTPAVLQCPCQLPAQASTNLQFLISSSLLRCCVLSTSACAWQARKHPLLHGKVSAALLCPLLPLHCSGVTGVLPASSQLEMALGTEQSIAENHCASTQTPLVRKKRNMKQSLFYKRETCRSYLHISGRVLMLQGWGQRGLHTAKAAHSEHPAFECVTH